MRLDPDEITALAESLASRVASILERRFSERPEWCFSPSEAAAWLQVDEHVVRHAIRAGKLPAVKLGNQVRIRRSDLFLVRGSNGGGEQ